MRRHSLWTLSMVLVIACCCSDGRRYSGMEDPSVWHMIHQHKQADSTLNEVSKRPSPLAYNALRNVFVSLEESKAFGSDIQLTTQEANANQIIMAAKTAEFEEGLITPHLFAPSQHFFSVLDQIKNSPLFKILSKMPKGAVLHAHDTALCSTDYLIELTYREHLWACHRDSGKEFVALKFSKVQPQSQSGEDCTWSLLADMRQENGSESVDPYLRLQLTMFPVEKFDDNNAAWGKFMSIFNLLDGLLMYAPVWGDYYYQALKEFYADGVQYLEFRTTLPTLYDMDGTHYTALDTARIYKETLDKFMAANPGFIGSKMIYAPVRFVDQAGIEDYIKICLQVKEAYPEFLAGFDLVGQEEMGGPLTDFIPQLLAMPNDIDFFFHAGETNWNGSPTDENLIDAVLLGTKRIGHGFALVKHPLVLQMLKQRDIAVEVNPISNQILQLVSDYRNHPCSHFFADNYPVVISSDDPSFWKATPLSHDFYIAFLGIASSHSDLRLLKKLALNSIKYSSLSADQKVVAMQKWQTQWDKFIVEVVNGIDNDSNGAQRRLMTNKID